MNNDTNQNQGQKQSPDIHDIRDIQNNKNNKENKNNNAAQRVPGQNQNPPRQIRRGLGNAVVPSNQEANRPNQNKPVQSQRANPVVAPRRPAPPDSPRRSNPQRQQQPGQKSGAARDANMADEFQNGFTKTFDKNSAKDSNNKTRNINNPDPGSVRSARTAESDGTYHYTGRDIKSSRQRFSDSDNKDNKIPGKRVPSEDDGNMKISANKEKIRAKNKNAEAESKRSGSIISGVLKVVLYILGVVVISGILAYNMIMMANDVFAFVKEPVAISVTIPENVDIEQISRILYENHLIKYPKIFNFYINYRQKDKEWEFEAGTYPVSSDMNYDDLIYTFRKKAAAREAVRITIPEGYTIDEIICEFVVKNNIGTWDKFVDVINNTDFSEYGYRFLKPLYETELSPDRKYRLEGYLFPDTYDFYKDETELNIIIRFLDNFNDKFIEDFYKKCEILDQTYLAQTGRHFTIDDAITLASIIEWEAKFPYDFPHISQVFHNRLLHSASFPHLESDATILYDLKQGINHQSKEHSETEEIRLGDHKIKVTKEDLEMDLPYNTYKCNGLPPSAVCNPGQQAIWDALYPVEKCPLFPEQNCQHYYFVADINTGEVFYAKTYDEHMININKARAGN